ncbi:MAG TPA: hypothetical protein VFD49_12050 [Candidatus Dormibacteraeota bacterium]|nr:hypothetical protein [Candidatus Dormibacteraeota bacterium]
MVTVRYPAELEAWVNDPTDHPVELRDGMLVRLFFSDAVGPTARLELARRLAARHRAKGDQLAGVCQQLAADPSRPRMHQEVLRLGAEFHDFLARWYEGLAARLDEKEETR